MIFVVSLLLQSLLPGYFVTVDPAQLEHLYEHYTEDLEIPATVSLDTLTADCTIAFRGGASLHLLKKSWHITLDEDDIFPGGGHILLSAQFLDPALMRNTLGHMLTRELGYPAPESEFVTLSVNGIYMGVYERVERIDRLFLERNGYGYGALFKSTHPMGRIVCQYAHTPGTHSFDPKIDSDPYKDQLLEFIEDCFRGDAASMATEEFLALLAVKTAISNRDGVIKNFYLHLWQGCWHVYPWDRDASFGNMPGEYIPGWVEGNSLYDIRHSGVARVLFESRENVQMYNFMMVSSAEIMEEKFPEVVDSIRLLIRDDLALDPFYEYTPTQFDSICTVLSNDIEARASFLTAVYLADPASTIESYEISSCLNLGDQLEFELDLEGGDPDGVILLLSTDGADEEMFYLPEEDDDEYEFSFDVPPGTYSVRMAFGPRIKPCRLPVFFPSWSLKNCEAWAVPAPGARVSLAPLEPSSLSPGFPVWSGENLWMLPVTNTADFVQDLSLCLFRIGDPSGTVFLPESILIDPGETFFLTNNAYLAEHFYSGQIFGDAGAAYPADRQLILDDPSWHQMYSWSIEGGDSIPIPFPPVIPSEISMGEGSDWVELYNSGCEAADMSGWYLMDSRMNISVFPNGTSLSPGKFLVAWEEPPQEEPYASEAFQLNFSLNSDEDSLGLFNSLGTPVFRMGWDDCWPVDETGIIYLQYSRNFALSVENWCAALPPGTPGEANPGWDGVYNYVRLRLVTENPSNGTFSVEYQSSSQPLEATLYDLTGRVVSRLDLQAGLSGTINADFSGMLSSGIYIVFLRSSTGMDSVRLTVLADGEK